MESCGDKKCRIKNPLGALQGDFVAGIYHKKDSFHT
jgi:hypothetical protein